jgi:hypothetical protein
MLKKVSLYLSLTFIGLNILSCQKNEADTVVTPAPTPKNDFFTVSYDVTSLPTSQDFKPAQNFGSVQNFALDEISGIAVGSKPNTLWVEEDSGNENKIYLIDISGTYLGSFRMTSIANRDWEDMSISSGPVPSTPYIYLAEIGDNNRVNQTKYIYRFPEPIVSGSTFPFSNEINTVDKIAFNYPDGIKNAEAIIIDPNTKDIYVISKEGQAVIYVARYPQDITNIFTLTKVGVLPISDVTSAAISPDGKEIIIKNYALALYWKKAANETIPELLKTIPQKAPYQPEDQGESICWATDGSGYFTTSEGVNQPIYFYKRK